MTAMPRPTLRSLGSDNHSGIHPLVLDAIQKSNTDHALPYGYDTITQALQQQAQHVFGDQALIFPVFNGTGANVTCLQFATDRWGSVVTSTDAHIRTSEAGAPEQIGALHLELVPLQEGLITPAALEQVLATAHDEHMRQPQVVSLTNVSEWGRVLSPAQVAELADVAHAYGCAVHVDGARISNAAAAAGVSLYDITTGAGVDLLSYGGTKNGALLAEAVVVLSDWFTPAAATPAKAGSSVGDRVKRLRKMSGQLPSKARFVAAQLFALLKDDAGLMIAAQANARAQQLAEGLQETGMAELVVPADANMVFAQVPVQAVPELTRQLQVPLWRGSAHPEGATSAAVRFVTSYDTTAADISRAVAIVQAAS